MVLSGTGPLSGSCGRWVAGRLVDDGGGSRDAMVAVTPDVSLAGKETRVTTP